MACLDIIDALGEGDKVVACATTTITYLEHYSPKQQIRILPISVPLKRLIWKLFTLLSLILSSLVEDYLLATMSYLR